MKIDAGINGTLGDRTYKLDFDTVAEYGREDRTLSWILSKRPSTGVM